MNQSPLAGITVIDFSSYLSGPYCSQLLRAAGAKVTKIEKARHGDGSRKWGVELSENLSSYFVSINRGKHSVSANLKNEVHRRKIIELCLQSDIVITNSMPGKMKELGIGKALLERKPALIVCAISGFGQDGPQKPTYDLIMQGLSGLQHITGNGVPTKIGVPLTDLITGINAFNRILMALLHREKTAEGAFIDVSMYYSALSLFTHEAMARIVSGKGTKRTGNHHRSIAPYGTFKDRAGKYFNLCVGNEAQWKNFCDAIGRRDLYEMSIFSSNSQRVKHRRKLIRILENEFQKKDKEHWIETLEKKNVPVGEVLSIDEVMTGEKLPFFAQAGKKMSYINFIEQSLGMPNIDRPAPNLGQFSL